jgi:hypothetical protein
LIHSNKHRVSTGQNGNRIYNDSSS